MLELKALNGWYGRSHVLQNVEMTVAQGEIVALIGRNGAGKTTTLRAIMGLLAKKSGQVIFAGEDLARAPTHHRFARGLAFVPEDRRIVAGLSVLENLRLGLLAAKQRGEESARIDEVAQRFPRLKERLSQMAVTLSGGEQQMLAIARAMMARPKMIMLDEPSEGIMPALVDEMADLFVEMKRAGTTLMLVEQNVALSLSLADRAYIIDQGRIVHQAPADILLADCDIQERYCAV